MKGPYGRPLVFDPKKLPSGQESSENLMVESLKYLKDSTSRFKLDQTLKSDEQNSQKEQLNTEQPRLFLKDVSIAMKEHPEGRTFYPLN